jgi:hypothetical protein
MQSYARGAMYCRSPIRARLDQPATARLNLSRSFGP